MNTSYPGTILGTDIAMSVPSSLLTPHNAIKLNSNISEHTFTGDSYCLENDANARTSRLVCLAMGCCDFPSIVNEKRLFVRIVKRYWRSLTTLYWLYWRVGVKDLNLTSKVEKVIEYFCQTLGGMLPYVIYIGLDASSTKRKVEFRCNLWLLGAS